MAHAMIRRDSTIEIPLPIKLAMSRENRAKSIFFIRFPMPGIRNMNLSVIKSPHSVFLEFLQIQPIRKGDRRKRCQ